MSDTSRDNLDDITIVRWKRCAEILGVSPVTLWRRRQNDPDFPPVVQVSPGINGITVRNLRTYVEKRSAR